MMPIEYSVTRAARSRLLVRSGARQLLAEELVALAPPPRRIAIISDRNVASFHLEALEESLRQADFEVKSFLVPPGEESKSAKMLESLWDRLLSFGMERSDWVAALGGGMVGDLAAMVASTLLRGVPVLQVPTSLMAQVDSSIGGKTGINRSLGKNLVGTFWQPRLVVIDPEYLATLPDREFRSGLGEVIKYGMIRDPTILAALRSCADLDALRASPGLEPLIATCVSVKIDLVRQDEREAGPRALLNFGHTVGHAIEAAEQYQGMLHGEAVAVGMVAATFLAVDLGRASPDLPAELSELLARFDLPSGTAEPPSALLPFLLHDKKRATGRARWVVVLEPGKAEIVTDPPDTSVQRALEAVHQP